MRSEGYCKKVCASGKKFRSLLCFCLHREDFKLILREVRRNNRNTLSGLSLDSIADQVRNIIEARERAKGGGDTKVKPRPPLPPVAQAPPPVHTSMEYTEEWSCVICYEDMDATDSSRLVCGHRFHTEVRLPAHLSSRPCVHVYIHVLCGGNKRMNRLEVALNQFQHSL